jgi:hypothetical protein
MPRSDSDYRVAHVARRYGALTEPFIAQRVASSGERCELWYERLDSVSPVPTRHIRVPALKPGGLGDRLFHHFPAFAPALARSYQRAERRYAPSLIHAHYLTTGYLVGMTTQAPLVVSAYGFDVSIIPQRRSWRPALNKLVERASVVLVEGPQMRDRVLRLGFSPEAVVVVPIAAQLDGVQYRDPSEPVGPLRIAICGRLVEKKGIDVIGVDIDAIEITEDRQKFRDLMERIAPSGPVYQAGTLSGNPLAMAAGLAQLLFLRESRPYDVLERRGRRLVDGLTAEARSLGVPFWGDALGGMWGLHFADGPVRDFEQAKRADAELFGRFFQACLRRGVYLPPSAFEAAFLSTAHDDDVIERSLERMVEALREAVAA